MTTETFVLARTGRTGGRWPHYHLEVAGQDLGSVRRCFPSCGANYSHTRSDGWEAAGRIHVTREEAEAALLERHARDTRRTTTP